MGWLCDSEWWDVRFWQRNDIMLNYFHINNFKKLGTSLRVVVVVVVVLFCFYFPSWYQLIFVWFNFLNFILHIFRVMMIIIRCSGMFRNVPCSWFYRQPLQRSVELFIQLVVSHPKGTDLFTHESTWGIWIWETDLLRFEVYILSYF